MKIMLDTNIIISAALFPNGRAAQAFYKALMAPYQPLICDYVVDELRRKFREKFPNRLTELEAFLFHALSYIQLVPTPEAVVGAESQIRDPKDRPILRAAIAASVDILLTGDKDFLESGITNPTIMAPAEFVSVK